MQTNKNIHLTILNLRWIFELNIIHINNYYVGVVQSLSCVRLFASPDTAAFQSPLFRQEYWLLLLLSCFSHVRLCATPEMAAHQARTLEWVAISFSMHESEKWKWSHSVVSDPQWPHWLQPSRLLHPWDFPGKSTGVGCHCLLHSFCGYQ